MNRVMMALMVLMGMSAQAAPRVAVVIDDFGLNYKSTPPDEEWMSLPAVLTFAVMPESPRTKKAAELTARTASKELIIHFPFDPFLSLKIEKDHLDPEDAAMVAALLQKSLKQIPGAKGLNNHRSYRATKNRPLMTKFMEDLKPTGLYFVDSKVSEKSVAYDEARAAGIPSAVNYIFLDTAELHTKAFCVGMLKRAVARARKSGSAVAIGHHYFRSTFDCLSEEIPRHQADGIEFVFASSLTAKT